MPAAPQLTARKVYLVDKPGAPQSQIRIGWVGVPRSTPDYFAVRVLNTVLGGSFTSRLNQNLREQHGYAYGASSSFDMRGSAGPFYAAAGVQTDKTAEALTEFFKELDAIRKPIPADELEKAKSYVALLLPRSFETTQSLAGSLAQMFIYNLPADYFATFTDHIRAVTSRGRAARGRAIYPAGQVRRRRGRGSEDHRTRNQGTQSRPRHHRHDRRGDEVAGMLDSPIQGFDKQCRSH